MEKKYKKKIINKIIILISILILIIVIINKLEEKKFYVMYYNYNTLRNIKVNKDGKISKLKNIERKGYYFKGWYDKEEQKNFDFSDKINKTKILIATWEKINDMTTNKVNIENKVYFKFNNKYIPDAQKKEVLSEIENNQLSNNNHETNLIISEKKLGSIIIVNNSYDWSQNKTVIIESDLIPNVHYYYKNDTNNEWIEINNKLLFQNFNKNTIISYKITDGIQEITGSYNIDKIDAYKPIINKINIVKKTSNSLSVNVNAIDLDRNNELSNINDISGIDTYSFSYDNGNTWSIPTPKNEFTFNNLEPNKNYNIKVKISDKSGNIVFDSIKASTSEKNILSNNWRNIDYDINQITSIITIKTNDIHDFYLLDDKYYKLIDIFDVSSQGKIKFAIYKNEENEQIALLTAEDEIYTPANSDSLFSKLKLNILDLSLINTSETISMKNMFRDTEINEGLNILSFKPSNTINMSFMFYGTKTPELNLSNFDTSNVINMSYMFSKTKIKELDLSNFDTSKVNNMYAMFSSSDAININISNFDTSNVTNMSYMFSSTKFEDINLKNFNTFKVIDMSYMFWESKLKNMDLYSFDTSNVVNMNHMFGRILVKELDLSNFDTSKVSSMSGMFLESSIDTLNLSSFNTSNVKSMSVMFYECNKLKNLNLTSFDTSNVTNMYGMFTGFSDTELDLSNFDTSNVINMSYMFAYSKLENINLEYFNTTNVVQMEGMFLNTFQLKYLNLSSFNISNLKNISLMFAQTAAKEIDISNFDFTLNELDLKNTFQGISNSTKIIIKDQKQNEWMKAHALHYKSEWIIFKNLNNLEE